MPQPRQLQKAELREIQWDDQQQAQETGRVVKVQFNPESLKVNFSNQSAGGDQRGGSAIQFVGQGTTKLSFDLWFDVTAAGPERQEQDDVRRLTFEVVKFIQPTPSDQEDKFIPPGIRFLWGTFMFDGIVDSINESLEFFSEDGKPLRAKLSLGLSRQEIQFQFGNQQSGGLGSTPGSRPQQQSREGDSVQSMAARQGRQDDWQSIAQANDIDNPRQLPPGTPLNTRA
ncbi:MAG: LysM peptidoglycan-binding domain-containing protein [Candidatus Competibacteraceae bacterium]|nr:LysM peptidoglycan-binding domain-containing protein [Candidatus Competibacteraceae bacterium]